MAWRIIGRLESRQPQRSVADNVRVARNVIARLWTRFQKTGQVWSWPGQIYLRSTTTNNDRYIQLTACQDRKANATQILRQFLLAVGWRFSSQTIRNRLHQNGLNARRPMMCIPLTARHRVDWKRLIVEHRGWMQRDWTQMLFTDESRFSSKWDTRRVLIWWERGTRNNPIFVQEISH